MRERTERRVGRLKGVKASLAVSLRGNCCHTHPALSGPLQPVLLCLSPAALGALHTCPQPQAPHASDSSCTWAVLTLSFGLAASCPSATLQPPPRWSEAAGPAAEALRLPLLPANQTQHLLTFSEGCTVRVVLLGVVLGARSERERPLRSFARSQPCRRIEFLGICYLAQSPRTQSCSLTRIQRPFLGLVERWLPSVDPIL